MSIRIYNTMNKAIERLELSEPPVVKMYVCGATVYDVPHIGHLRYKIVFDTFVRFLEFAGYDVKYVENITDVEDKIIERAKQLGLRPSELAFRMTLDYFRIMDTARVRASWLTPRATDYIQEIVDFIGILMAKGYAYASGGDVYFRVRRFERYGKLSGQSLEALRVGIRVEPDERKESPEDFALWKSAKEDEPSWPSPWGKGRPGWHIECSVMAHASFGGTLDIHGGGNDLIFPHHENEIAQSEAGTGEPLARYWMHNGMVNMKGEKMGKSLKNVVNAREVLEMYGVDAVRLYILRTHYRAPLEFDLADLDSARRTVEKLDRRLSYIKEVASSDGEVPELTEDAAQKFSDRMADDLDTPNAITGLMAHTDELYERARSGVSISDKACSSLRKLWGVLGMFETLGIARGQGRAGAEADLIKLLLDLREDERREGNYEGADRIRRRLADLGVTVEDTAKGPRWYYSAM